MPEIDDDRPLAAPARIRRFGELRAARELVRAGVRTPALLSAAKGNGQTVVALPGFGSNDLATLPLRRYLVTRRMRTFGWELGVNGGDVAALLPPVTERVRSVVVRTGKPAHLIGWSLGGVLAREVARDEPELVHQVITYGTPVVGGPKYTTAAQAYGEANVNEIAIEVAARNQIPITVPVTAMYSRKDGIVDWRACIDDFSPDVENIEVTSTHVGMGLDPDVWSEIVERIVNFDS